MEQLRKRLTNLLCVKSIVTLILTIVFAYLAITGRVAEDQVLSCFTVVLGFYFGTQSERKAQAATKADEGGDANV